MSDPTVPPVVPPAPKPPAPTPVNLPWTFYAILGMVILGCALIFAAGMWAVGLLTAVPGPAPLPPPAPATISLTVPADIAVGNQFVVKSDAAAPVTWIEHGLPGMRGHVGAETQTNGRFSGSYAVTAHAKGKYPVIAATIANGKIVATSKLIDMGDPAPPTPPAPGPSPPSPPAPPTPPTPPAPIAGNGVRVLIVYDSSDPTKLTKDAQAVIFGKSFRDFLNEACVVGADGKTKEYRIFDKDVTGEPKVWSDAMARPRPSLPWLVASNGRTGFEGPLTSEADATKIISALRGN